MKPLSRPALIAIVALLVGVAIGGSAVWLAQSRRIAALRAEVAGLEASMEGSRNADVLREALEERDRTIGRLMERLNELGNKQAAPKKQAEETAPVRQFAFIKSISLGSNPTLVADYASFLSGEAAAAAAKKDGAESPPPNDYYIDNINPRLRTLKVSDDVTVRLATKPGEGSIAEGYDSDLETLAGYLASSSDDAAGLRAGGYWLTLEDGVVVAIEEQYTP